MSRSFRDRLDLDKPAIIKIAMGVGISVLIMLIVFFTQSVTKGTYNAYIIRMAQIVTIMDSKVANNTANIDNLQTQMSTTQGLYETISGTVGSHTTTLNSLNSRMTDAETKIAQFGSPPEAYLTGNFTSGNLTLHAKSSDSGNYTANVYLVFTPLISAGNATTYDEAAMAFHASVNWSAANVKVYTPVASYNSTAWGISQVWWNIGTFALTANIDTSISVLFGGLANTPSFAYVEIYPVLK